MASTYDYTNERDIRTAIDPMQSGLGAYEQDHFAQREASRYADGSPNAITSAARRSRQVNQQFISLLANVGSTVLDAEIRDVGMSRDPLAQSHYFQRERVAGLGNILGGTGSRARSPRGEPQSAMLRSLPALKKPPSRRKHRRDLSDPMLSSQILERPVGLSPYGQKVEEDVKGEGAGKAEVQDEHSGATMAQDGLEQDMIYDDRPTASEALEDKLELADMLVKVFGFREREEIIADYPCYLMQSSLLQGSIYILKNYICFYAYLPVRSHSAVKSGFVWKRGRQNPKYNHYWFVLKGDVLSYYKSASQLYFPRGTVDLHSAVSAQIVRTREPDTEQGDFTITTPQETLTFRADSVASAKEWVKQIQSAIFRSQNDDDSVKIVLPIPNILDVEENPVLEAANTLRLRVIDNDETYAIDEYFFTFFGHGNDAFNTLRTVIERRGEKFESTPLALEPVQEFGQPQKVEGAFAGALETAVSQRTSRLSGSANDTQQSMMIKDQLGNIITERGGHPSGQIWSPELIIDSTPHTPTDQYERPSSRRPSDDPASSGVPKTPRSRLKRPTIQSSSSFTKIHEAFKAGSYSIQKASDLAVALKAQSKRMGGILANESLGYYEKAYNMWAGKKMHYNEGEGSYPGAIDRQDTEQERKHGDRFRAHFSLHRSEKLQATYYTYLSRVVPVYGKIYVGTSRICFRSLLPGTRTKMILPLKDVENVVQEKGFRFGYFGLVIGVRGHEEIFFEFRESDARDDCVLTLLEIIESTRLLEESRVLTEEEVEHREAARAEHDLLQQARRNSAASGKQRYSNRDVKTENVNAPVLFDDSLASLIDFKPPEPLNIVCLTIGSRGDVQPFIALCKGLQAEGHKPKLATHTEFEGWIRSHGIDFAPVAGNPAEIMRLCVENDMFTVNFIREAHKKFRGFIDDLLDSACVACEGADLLIESPSAMAGIHIAEAMQIPYFRAFTMPWTRTRAYPHAFAVPTHKLGGNYNMMTYVMFDNLFWQAMAGQINRWRKKRLDLSSTNLDKLQTDKVPFLYNFSPSVVIPPIDFNHWIRITGYWFLDEGTTYTPDARLAAFIRDARAARQKLVYVGFGSVVVDDPAELTRSVVQAVLKADVRCILSKGWSDRLDKLDKDSASSVAAEIPLPDAIHQISGAPHDWLFRQVDAAAHHGGAGTTGASIRAGIPTIVKPFFGDQYFFGSRVEDLGVGVSLAEITESGLAQALQKVTTDKKMIERARKLGEKIRSEDGVKTAIQAIYRDLEYAKSLIKRQAVGTGPGVDEMKDGSEESWTLVGDESEPEAARHAARPEGVEFQSSLAQRRQSEDPQDGSFWTGMRRSRGLDGGLDADRGVDMGGGGRDDGTDEDRAGYSDEVEEGVSGAGISMHGRHGVRGEVEQ